MSTWPLEWKVPPVAVLASFIGLPGRKWEISVTRPMVPFEECRYSTPGIQERDAGSGEIRNVSGDESKRSNFSSSGEEGIHNADGPACGQTSAYEASPSVGDYSFNDQNTAIEAQR